MSTRDAMRCIGTLSAAPGDVSPPPAPAVSAGVDTCALAGPVASPVLATINVSVANTGGYVSDAVVTAFASLVSFDGDDGAAAVAAASSRSMRGGVGDGDAASNAETAMDAEAAAARPRSQLVWATRVHDLHPHTAQGAADSVVVSVDVTARALSSVRLDGARRLLPGVYEVTIGGGTGDAAAVVVRVRVVGEAVTLQHIVNRAP